MTDRKGATAPGFHKIIEKNDALVARAENRLELAVKSIQGGVDQRPNVRRIRETLMYISHAYEALLMAQALAELRESGDG